MGGGKKEEKDPPVPLGEGFRARRLKGIRLSSSCLLGGRKRKRHLPHSESLSRRAFGEGESAALNRRRGREVLRFSHLGAHPNYWRGDAGRGSPSAASAWFRKGGGKGKRGERTSPFAKTHQIHPERGRGGGRKPSL